MERRRNFYELTHSLSSGFFSDNVMMLISRIKYTKQLLPSDKEVLDLAEHFFGEVLSGYKWSDNPTFSEKSLRDTNSFSQAVDAVVLTPYQESFKDYINNLKAAITEVKNQRFDNKNLELLDDFFYNLSKSELQKTDSLINRAPIPFPA